MQMNEQRQRLVLGRVGIGIEAHVSLQSALVGHGDDLTGTDLEEISKAVRRFPIGHYTSRRVAILVAVFACLDGCHCRWRIVAGQRSDLGWEAEDVPSLRCASALSFKQVSCCRDDRTSDHESGTECAAQKQ